MSRVSYNQSGYIGSSMSERAALAYQDGEMPISKWTKAAIIQALQGWCRENYFNYDPSLEKLTKKDLTDKFIRWSSWHHTSKFANETDFYSLNDEECEETFEPMSEEEVAILEEELRIAEERKRQLLAEKERERQAARAAELKREEERKDFYRAYGCWPNTYRAYVLLHSEEVPTRISQKGNVVYSIPWKNISGEIIEIHEVAEKNLDGRFWHYDALKDEAALEGLVLRGGKSDNYLDTDLSDIPTAAVFTASPNIIKKR